MQQHQWLSTAIHFVVHVQVVDRGVVGDVGFQTLVHGVFLLRNGNERLHDNGGETARLEQNGKLYRQPPTDHLCGRVAHEALQRACQMRLVGIAEPIHDVEDRHILLQKGHGIAGALNLTDAALT